MFIKCAQEDGYFNLNGLLMPDLLGFIDGW
jgi:hypothetical protein